MKTIKKLPQYAELENLIQVVPITIFELSKEEIATLRRHLYAVNKDGIRRYKTLLDGKLLLVWRLK